MEVSDCFSMKLCLFVKARFCVSFGLILPCCWEAQFRQGFVSVLGCLFAMLGRIVVNYGCVSFGWVFNGVVFVCLSTVVC